jgi:hypothetical protein
VGMKRRLGRLEASQNAAKGHETSPALPRSGTPCIGPATSPIHRASAKPHSRKLGFR